MSPLIIQADYVKALAEMAKSPSNKVIVVPVGSDGQMIIKPTADLINQK